MKTVRLTLRLLFSILGLPLMPAIALICLIAWTMDGNGDVFGGTLRPWLRNLRHPFTP